MLALSRRVGERIIITVGDIRIEVAYLGMHNGQGRIGVLAPKHVKILRWELTDEAQEVGGAA